MATADSSPMHVVCGCGQRLRVRNAQAGQPVECPRCRRPVPVAAPSLTLEPAEVEVATERNVPRPAILLDGAALRLAPNGARIGLTGRFAHAHDEALLMTARAGRPIDTPGLSSHAPRPGAADGDAVVSTAIRGDGGFLSDVLATYYFAGSRMNFVHVLATATICGLLLTIATLFSVRILLLTIVHYGLLGIVTLIAVQFFWSVLSVTAAGSDDLPLVAPDWDPWADAVRPTLLVLVVTLVCAAPMIYVDHYVPRSTVLYPILMGAGLLIGTALWPMAVLSVGIANTLWAARPDLVVRSIIGVGWAYAVAWLAVVVTVVSWAATYAYHDRIVNIPRVGPGLVSFLQVGLTFYYGYALFRILGLLYRHYEGRMAWR